MIRILLLCCISALLAAACKKNDHPVPWPDGLYKGSFQRLHVPGNGIAEVSLEFRYPNWSGSSNLPKYPALGKGKYSYTDQTFTVENISPWTADFDWTLIFNGAYIDRVEGDSLVITKSYGDGAIDLYKLKKQ